MAEQKEMNGCGMCKMHGGCHSWVARALLMIAILGIVFFCGVEAGELKATVRGMHGYGRDRGNWGYGNMPMMQAYPVDSGTAGDVLYQ